MKPTTQKLEFIRLRAEGQSFQSISDTLSISKDTCSQWERELKDQITTLKAEQLKELYESYYMIRESRITQLGETLKGINKALESADLEALPPDKLLDFKLKYMQALKDEYIDPEAGKMPDKPAPKDILYSMGDLLNRLRSGAITSQQAAQEARVIGSMLQAYDLVNIKERVDMLDSILQVRR